MLRLTLLLLAASLFLAPTAEAGGFSPRAPKAIYEIFVRSFQDANGDGQGDLAGVISRLDQLAWLGVDAVWLTPIFPSPSSHGYDTTDYLDVNPAYGDKALFARLIGEAHRRGIRVFLDIAINHTSIQHPWFQSSAAGGPDHDLYIWAKQPPPSNQLPRSPRELPGNHWHKHGNEYYYSTFSETLPDLNWRNPEVMKRIAAVFQTWSRAGVDGFRLDAAKHLIKGPHGEDNQPETHLLWQKLVALTRQVNPQTYFIGEIWDGEAVLQSYYGSGNELDAAFDFPLASAVRESIAHSTPGAFVNALSENLKTQRSPDFALPFTGNHDWGRLTTAVGNDEANAKLAAVATLTLPGSPVIYFGDELGTPQGILPAHKGDLGQRTPLAWTAGPNHGFTAPGARPWNPFASENPLLNFESESKVPTSLLRVYHDLLSLRGSVPALRWGKIVDPRTLGPSAISFWRADPQGGRGPVFVALNFGNSPITNLVIPRPPLQLGDQPKSLWGAAAVRNVENGIRLDSLGAHAGFVGGY